MTDPSKNMDKFINLQVLKVAGNFYFASSWGRNGTSGQFQLKGPFTNSMDAITPFRKKFKQKTGTDWDNRDSAGRADSDARGGHGHYEIVKRLKAAGAGMSTKKGSIAISLMWSHHRADRRNDLDLWVTAPSGERIGYSHKHSACGGNLDVDRMQNAEQPVENIVWQNKAPIGTYKIQVHNYSLNHSDDMPFHVSIVKDGKEDKREMLPFTMPGECKKWMDIKSFEYK